MVRSPSFDKYGRRTGKWNEEEDNQLRAYIEKHGHPQNWRQLPKFAGLNRCGKSCRLRWENYLDPKKRRGNYSQEEEDLIIKLHQKHGNKWSLIASKLPGRTDNDIKNHCHTDPMRRKMAAMMKEGHSKASSSTTKIEDIHRERYYSQHNMDDVSDQNFNVESSYYSMPTFTSSSDPIQHIDIAPIACNDYNKIDVPEVNFVAVDQTTCLGSNELVSSSSNGITLLPGFDDLLDVDWPSEYDMSSQESIMKILDDDLLDLDWATEYDMSSLKSIMNELDDDYFSTRQLAAFAMAADSTFHNIDGDLQQQYDLRQQFPASSSDEEFTELRSSFQNLLNATNLEYQLPDLIWNMIYEYCMV